MSIPRWLELKGEDLTVEEEIDLLEEADLDPLEEAGVLKPPRRRLFWQTVCTTLVPQGMQAIALQTTSSSSTASRRPVIKVWTWPLPLEKPRISILLQRQRNRRRVPRIKQLRRRTVTWRLPSSQDNLTMSLSTRGNRPTRKSMKKSEKTAKSAETERLNWVSSSNKKSKN